MTDYARGTLRVFLLRGVIPSNELKHQNLFCVLKFKNLLQSTVVKGGGENLEWNEEIKFNLRQCQDQLTNAAKVQERLSHWLVFVPPPRPDRVLHLSCYWRGPLSKELIGECSINVSRAIHRRDVEIKEWLTLKNHGKDSGRIQLEISYQRETSYPWPFPAPSPAVPIVIPGPSMPQGIIVISPTPSPPSSVSPLPVVDTLSPTSIAPSQTVAQTLPPSPYSRFVSIPQAHSRGPSRSPRRHNVLPWEIDLKGFQFLKFQTVCNPSLIGAFDDWVVSTSSAVLVFTLMSRVIIYNIERQTAREIDYGFRVKSIPSVAHSLSPDGRVLVRWTLEDSEGRLGMTFQPSFLNTMMPNSTFLAGAISAIDTSNKTPIAILQHGYQCQQYDILNAKWVNGSIYIPVSAEGIVIRWNVRDSVSQDNHSDSSTRPEHLVVLRPLASITRHTTLKYDITKDEAWWTATGMTVGDKPTGLIEIHDVKNDESRIVVGIVSCIAEVDVYDRQRPLLVSADITSDFKLRICVQQLQWRDSGQSFIPVDVKVDLLEERDYPRDIMVLYPLPIVAVLTAEYRIYFFELHTGAYLFTQRQKAYRLCHGQTDLRGLLMRSQAKSDVQVLSINEGDLIGYCRQVLGNDMLASTIAVRTGLPGAEDVIFDEMHRQWRRVSSVRSQPTG
ncbi:hypothetical protein FRC02_009947 [Tulasnella sp. 418]|nr:hypothetical protein FRC02_009947 [Tulasnella sp. 418]